MLVTALLHWLEGGRAHAMVTSFGRCLRCRHRYSWPGGHAERPPCPDCGAEPDRELGELLDAELARIEESSRTERRQREASRR